MALNMATPTKHPKTGVYRVRLGIPKPLQETAKALFGARHELIQSLGTKDPREARVKAPPAIAALQAKLEEVRAANAGNPAIIPEQAVKALAGRFYEQQLAQWGADPGPSRHWEAEMEDILERAEQGPKEGSGPVDPSEWEYKSVALPEDLPLARLYLEDAGYIATSDAIDRVAKAICHARFLFAQSMHRRAQGNWAEDPNLGTFPPLPNPGRQAKPDAVTPGVTVDDLLASWARDRGIAPQQTMTSRAYYDRLRTLERLCDFLGHRDALRVTKADAVRWKESMQGRSLAIPTIRNDISEMSAIWAHAIRNGKLEGRSNPFEGVAPPKPKARTNKRRPFTDVEARQILTAARQEKGLLRWAPWLCCLTGARLSEVCQAFKEDILKIDGVPVRGLEEGAVGALAIDFSWSPRRTRLFDWNCGWYDRVIQRSSEWRTQDTDITSFSG